ncbi:uncharacterized protein EI97DRAFT_435889 [Westerdykella ornata]|uniref:Rrn9 domain-containing protein n=1 Tax=Westerdykella ornata TaxID=318751 RepID=A0A6A6JBC1_WESOR|nr:uncharacterized protein EI97DRAFT_435889 [Westerdykella ornata]KAF2273722.1 hypothetical protein EI97DRAFT_435889 [Westerdykella ornata]
MSLFGGDGTPPDDPSQSEIVAPSATADTTVSTTASSPTSHIPEEAQNAQIVSFSTYDAEDEEDEVDDESDQDAHAAGGLRPNRFVGKASTWRGYTASDRNIAASLEEIQARDLAAHLFNTHALKRRVRRPESELKGVKNWQSKDDWMKKGADLEFVDIAGDRQVELVPPKRWTAWPLPAEDVPIPLEQLGRKWVEGSIVGPSEWHDPGDNLREEILAVCLRLATRKFRARKTEIAGIEEIGGRSRAQSRARSKSVASARASSRAPSLSPEVSDEDRREGFVARDADEETGSQIETETKFAHVLNAKGKRLKLQANLPRPTVLADDEAARRILGPSINSLLARVDRLAEGIRRTRLNHFGRGNGSDTSASEGISDFESVRSSSRSVSRSRSRSVSTTRSTSRARSGTASRSPSTPQKPRSSNPKPTKSRKRRRPADEDSDSASDFGADYGLDSPSSSEMSSPSPSTKRLRMSRETSVSSANREASIQIGLLDWSEVLGIASMTGWNSKAIARTAQRCAALFGEGMSFLPLDEGLAAQPSPPQPVHFTPSTIPPLDITDKRKAVKKRPYFDVGTLRCPHPECRQHHEDYSIPYRVIEHCIRVHGYDPRTNDSDNEDRKVGGVHIDGFLQPITAKQGWLGAGRAKSRSKGASGGEGRGKRKGKGKAKMKVEEDVGDEGEGEGVVGSPS